MFLTFSVVSFAQNLLPEASRVKEAYEKLFKDPFRQDFRKAYVMSFPSNSKIFLKVFHPKSFDQLYSVSYEYVDALQRCAASYPKEGISKCVDIGKELIWDADAVSFLQKASVTLAAKYPTVFVEKYNTLHDDEKNKLITFYADVENHPAYTEYQELIDSMKKVGSNSIARKLEIARTERRGIKHH